MQTVNKILVGFFIFSALVLGADRSADADVTMALIDTAGNDGRPTPLYGYFGGQTKDLALRIAGSEHCVRIEAQMVQISAHLEAELVRKRLLDCEGNDDWSLTKPRDITLSFTVPEVKRKSAFVWRFAACDIGTPTCRPLLEVDFTAYPDGLLAGLEDWAKQNFLVVVDREGRLQETLDRHEIEFVDRLTDPREARLVSMIVARDEAPADTVLAKYLARGGVILFRERPTTLPMVKAQTLNGQNFVTVDIPLLDRLNIDPIAQEAFVEIFRMALSGENRL